MDTLSQPVPARCQGCTEQIADLEQRLAKMEVFFAVLKNSRRPGRPTAAQRAAERWQPAAS